MGDTLILSVGVLAIVAGLIFLISLKHNPVMRKTSKLLKESKQVREKSQKVRFI